MSDNRLPIAAQFPGPPLSGRKSCALDARRFALNFTSRNI